MKAVTVLNKYRVLSGCPKCNGYLMDVDTRFDLRTRIFGEKVKRCFHCGATYNADGKTLERVF
ncbi:MAG: hypothetical protein QW561_01285 [Candidatus Aenigmatarchaeota archaeon]